MAKLDESDPWPSGALDESESTDNSQAAVVEDGDVAKFNESGPWLSGTLDDTDNKPVVTPTRPDRQIRRFRLTLAGNEGARRGRKLRCGLERPYRCPVRNISRVLTCFTHRLPERCLHKGSLPLSFVPIVSDDGEKGISESERTRLSP